MSSTVVVGVPVWNGERFLERCVASLLDQSVRPDEIVISDNASTDGTAWIAAGLAAAEPSVRVLRNDTNLGAAVNYNRLVAETESDLFAWLPHDDVWSPSLLEESKWRLEAEDVALAYGRTEYIDSCGCQDGKPDQVVWSGAGDPVTRMRELFADPARSHLHVCTPVLGVIRRSVLVDTGLIRPFGGSDKVTIVELALRGRLVQLDAPFFRRRHAESSVSANPDAESRRRWFDPAARGPAMATSRLAFAFAAAVARAPLDVPDRIRCEVIVARWLASGGRPLRVAGELLDWAKDRAGHARREA